MVERILLGSRNRMHCCRQGDWHGGGEWKGGIKESYVEGRLTIQGRINGNLPLKKLPKIYKYVNEILRDSINNRNDSS